MAFNVRTGITSLIRAAQPPAPPSGQTTLYPKADGWYSVGVDGVEQPLKGGAGTPSITVTGATAPGGTQAGTMVLRRGGNFSHIAATGTSGSVRAWSLPVTTAIPAGSTAVAMLQYDPQADADIPLTVTDLNDNLWVIARHSRKGASIGLAVAYSVITTALKVNQTIDFATSNRTFVQRWTATVGVFDGILTPVTGVPVDQVSAPTSGTGTAISVSAPAATTQAEEISVFGIAAFATPSTPGAYSKVGAQVGSGRSVALAWRSLTAIGTETATGALPSSVDWTAALVTFRVDPSSRFAGFVDASGAIRKSWPFGPPTEAGTVFTAATGEYRETSVHYVDLRAFGDNVGIGNSAADTAARDAATKAARRNHGPTARFGIQLPPGKRLYFDTPWVIDFVLPIRGGGPWGTQISPSASFPVGGTLMVTENLCRRGEMEAEPATRLNLLDPDSYASGFRLEDVMFLHDRSFNCNPFQTNNGMDDAFFTRVTAYGFDGTFRLGDPNPTTAGPGGKGGAIRECGFTDLRITNCGSSPTSIDPNLPLRPGLWITHKIDLPSTGGFGDGSNQDRFNRLWYVYNRGPLEISVKGDLTAPPARRFKFYDLMLHGLAQSGNTELTTSPLLVLQGRVSASFFGVALNNTPGPSAAWPNGAPAVYIARGVDGAGTGYDVIRPDQCVFTGFDATSNITGDLFYIDGVDRMEVHGMMPGSVGGKHLRVRDAGNAIGVQIIWHTSPPTPDSTLDIPASVARRVVVENPEDN